MPQNYANFANIRVAEALATGKILQALGDRTSFVNHPALLWCPNPGNTATVKIPEIDFGLEEMGDFPEGTPITETAFTLTSSTVTVARKGIFHSTTDLARWTGGWLRNPEIRARHFLHAATNKLAAMVAAAAAAGTNVTVAGAPASVLSLYIAKNGLEQRFAGGRVLLVLHPVVFGSLQRDALAQNNTFARIESVQEFVLAWGPSYRGSIGNIDIVTSSKVPFAAGVYSNLLLAESAVAWSSLGMDIDNPGEQALFGAGPESVGGQMPAIPMLYERNRSVLAGEHGWVGSAFLGASIAQNAAIQVWQTTG
jgi:hypothetical protein